MNVVNEIKISDVLNEIENLPDNEIEPFLKNKYYDKQLLVESVMSLLSANGRISSPAYSSLLKKHSLDLMNEFDPKQYIGEVFGDWLVESIIHVTKKSAVFKAIPADQSFDQYAAIKILLPTFECIAGDNTSMQAHYISRLKHVNIVEGYGKGTLDNGISYVVMEYLTENNIVEFCKNKKLGIDKVCQLFLQVCSGVEHMHIRGCVHSDFKPNNIYIDVNGIPKIIDFDLSRATNSNFHNQRNFKNINGLTRKYAAPEHVKDDGVPTSLSDIYSLGCIFAEMIIGSEVVVKQDYKELIESKYKSNWRIKELISIVDKALRDNPTDRYHGINDMARDIKQYLEGRKIVSSYNNRSSFFYKARYFIRNNMLLISFVIIVALALLFAMNRYIAKENESKESLKLLIESSSPYILERDKSLDIKAEKIFKSAFIISQDHYDKLISFGDIYISRGNAFKASKFYKKAADIYPDKMSENKIYALSKLALAFYTQGEIGKANEVIYPYGKHIFVDKVTSPYLMKMAIVAFTINNKFLQSTILSVFGEQMTVSPSELLSSIDISDYPETMRKDMEIELIMSQVKSDYYAFPGDSTTILDNTTERIYKGEIRPMLKVCSDKLRGVIDRFTSDKERLLIRPEVYLWLSRCEAELGNISEASEYNEIGIELTEQVFGFHHAKTLHAYLVRYSIFRGNNSFKARKAVLTAFDIRKRLERAGKSDDTFRFFTHQMVFEEYFSKGEFDKCIEILDELLIRANKIGFLSTVDESVLSTMLSYFTDSLMYLYLPEKNKKKYSYYIEEFNKFNRTDKAYFFYDHNASDLDNLKRMEESYEYIMKEYDFDRQSPFDVYKQSNEYAVVALQSLSVQCLKIKGCDVESNKKRLQYAIDKTYWGDEKYINKTAKLIDALVNSYFWFEFKDYTKSKESLKNVEYIIDSLSEDNNYSKIYTKLNNQLVGK